MNKQTRLVDPIAHAWKLLQHVPLPKTLEQSDIQRAAISVSVLGRKGKGKHTMAVCS